MPVFRFIAPCLPSPADRPPSGPEWVHEIKHDGYRLMANHLSIRPWTDINPKCPLYRLIAVTCNTNGYGLDEVTRTS